MLINVKIPIIVDIFTFIYLSCFWSGNDKGQGCEGFLLAEKWIEKVFNVQLFSDRIIFIRLIKGKEVYTFNSVEAPQSGLTEADKQSFYDMLQSVVAKIPSSEIVIPFWDWNGHVGLECNRLEDVHGGHGFGTRNVEGERMLEFALVNDLVVCFIKRKSHLVTLNSGTNRTHIDFILYQKSFRKAVKDVKVIPDEKCVQQHNLVVCDLSVLIPRPKKHKVTLVSALGNYGTKLLQMSSKVSLLRK